MADGKEAMKRTHAISQAVQDSATYKRPMARGEQIQDSASANSPNATERNPHSGIAIKLTSGPWIGKCGEKSKETGIVPSITRNEDSIGRPIHLEAVRVIWAQCWRKEEGACLSESSVF